MSREGKLIKNTMILALGSFLPKLASIIILPILTGYLTQDEYGTYDLITVLVSLLLPAVTLQIQTAAFRFLIDTKDDAEKHTSIITNIFAYTVPASVVAIVVAFFYLSQISILNRSLICLYFIFDVIANTEGQVLRGLSKNLSYSFSAVIASFGQLVFAIIFVYFLKIGMTGAILCLFVSAMLSAIYMFFWGKIYNFIDFSKMDRTVIKELLKYSWPMVPNSMSMWVMRVSDRLVISFFMGVSANAVYAVANKIPAILTLAQNTFNMAWQENASLTVKDADSAVYYNKMFHALYDFVTCLFALLLATSPMLFKILVRGDYDSAYIQMPILFLAMFFFCIAGYLGGIYVAYKKTKSVGLTTFIAAIVNFVVDIVLIKRIGLFAASGSTLVSYIILCLYRMYDVKKIVDIKYNWKHMSTVLIVLVVMSILTAQQTMPCYLINVVIALVVVTLLEGELICSILKKKKIIHEKAGQNKLE